MGNVLSDAALARGVMDDCGIRQADTLQLSDDDVAPIARLFAEIRELRSVCEAFIEAVTSGTVYENGEPSYYNGQIGVLFGVIESAGAALAEGGSDES